MYQNQKLFKISFLAFFLFCLGCQKEELQINEKAPKKNIFFKEWTFQEVASRPAIQKILQGEEKINEGSLKTSESGGTALEREHGFLIDHS